MVGGIECRLPCSVLVKIHLTGSDMVLPCLNQIVYVDYSGGWNIIQRTFQGCHFLLFLPEAICSGSLEPGLNHG